MKIRMAYAIFMMVVTIATWGRAESAKVLLLATQPSIPVNGTIDLQDTAAGLQMDVAINQAPAGEHAFHIHEFGSCDGQGMAAGGHFNPAGHPHGNTMADGIAKAHAGDFGSITIGSDGKGSLHTVIPGLTLSKGAVNVAGRAFILHEKKDDFSQPTGNAGGRIGCGPILIVKP